MVKTIKMLKFVANQIPTYKFATSTKKSTAITCLIVSLSPLVLFDSATTPKESPTTQGS